MPIDREQTLKQAEKLLRQGRLEAAIAEYGRVVADFPRDWATANLLGDLYVRAGDAHRAVSQYARVADHLAADGFVAKAAALYKKILKLEPGDEGALLRSADLAAAQGLVADLRTYLNVLFQQRLKRGDREGARELAAKRVSYDTADVVARLDAARMLAEAGDGVGAATELRVAGLTLDGQGRSPEATRALRESLRFDPSHQETRTALVRLLVAQGDADGAAEVASTPEHRRALVAELTARGQEDAARRVLERLVETDPADTDARLDLARRCLAAGDLDRAESCLASHAGESEPAVALVLAEVEARRGLGEASAARVADLLARCWDEAPRAGALAEHLAPTHPDAAAAVIVAVARAAAERREFPWARHQLRTFLRAVPSSLAAWRGLLDLSIDAGFPGDLEDAQSHVADLLLAEGRWQDAMAVAEDLVASHPGDPAHGDRLRRAMTGLGLDPGPMLARLTQVAAIADDEAALEPLPREPPAEADDLLSEDFSDLMAALSQPQSPPQVDVFDLGGVLPPLAQDETPSDRGDAGTGAMVPRGMGIFDEDLRRMFEEEPGRDRAEAAGLTFEVDLSRALEALGAADEAPAPPATFDGLKGLDPKPAVAAEPAAPGDLDAFFRQLRDEAGKESRTVDARRLFDEGQASYADGQYERAVAQLRAAAREPSLRLQAARQIARIAKEQGHLNEAIEWLERAAEVPAPSLDTWQDLLFELAETLQQAGETARALAVLLELRAATPGYRDLDARIAALSAEPPAWSGEPPGPDS